MTGFGGSLGERIIVVVILLEFTITFLAILGVGLTRLLNHRVRLRTERAHHALIDWFPRVLLGDEAAIPPRALLAKLPPLRARLLLTEVGEHVTRADRLPLRELYLALGFGNRPRSRGFWERLIAVREARALHDPANELGSLLADKEAEVRVATFEALCDLGRGAEALTGLDAIARDGRSSRFRAVDALERAGLPEALLLGRSHAESSETRQVAVAALAHYTTPSSATRLVEALGDPDFEVRLQALRSVGRLADPAALEPCRALLLDSAWQVRLEAVRTTATLGGARVAPDLAPLLDDPEEWVRHHAARSLAQCGAAGLDALGEAASRGHRSAASALAETERRTMV